MDINKFIEPIGAFDVNIESSNSCCFGEGFSNSHGNGNGHGEGIDNSNGYSVTGKNNGDGSGIGKGFVDGDCEFKPQNLYGKHR